MFKIFFFIFFTVNVVVFHGVCVRVFLTYVFYTILHILTKSFMFEVCWALFSHENLLFVFVVLNLISWLFNNKSVVEAIMKNWTIYYCGKSIIQMRVKRSYYSNSLPHTLCQWEVRYLLNNIESNRNRNNGDKRQRQRKNHTETCINKCDHIVFVF